MNPAVLLTDLSQRSRVGCKGPGAESWLAGHGINVPPAANSYAVDSSGVLCARLATSEFLLEAVEERDDCAVQPVKRALMYADYPKGVYPVLRNDCVIELSGSALPQLFAQTCAVDLTECAQHSTASAGPVILTSMIGVSVVLTCRQAPAPRFTVWSDPSYGHYFWTQLLAIATDLGGGASPASPIRT